MKQLGKRHGKFFWCNFQECLRFLPLFGMDCSPLGRIPGRMGHAERVGKTPSHNVAGSDNWRRFAAIGDYFQI